MDSLRPVAAVAAVVLLGASGCYVSDRYLLSEQQLAQVGAMSEVERAGVAVPAIRPRDGQAVWVRADALPAPLPSAPPAVDGTPPGRRLVTARRYSPMVTAGAVLTYIGSVASVVGTIGFFAGEGPVKLSFGLLALSGEPPMIIGSVLWPLGLHRRPQETKPGQPGLRYLDAEPPAPMAPAPLAPSPIVGLRF